MIIMYTIARQGSDGARAAAAGRRGAGLPLHRHLRPFPESASLTIATWLKDLVDTVAVDPDPFPVFLLFVGSERVLRELASRNESGRLLLLARSGVDRKRAIA